MIFCALLEQQKQVPNIPDASQQRGKRGKYEADVTLYV